MKPVINSHLDYRRFLNGIGGMYRINWRSKPPAIREIYLRFRELDLSAVDRIMQDQYSSRECWYFGYDLYLLTDADSELPLFPLYHATSKHDSHGFCEAFFRFRALAPDLKPASLLLDSAHDSMAMYSLCQREHIAPLHRSQPG